MHFFPYNILFVLLLLAQLTVSCSNFLGEKIPTFEATTIDGYYFSSEELDNCREILVVIFDPLCEQCRYEIQQLLPYMTRHSETTFVLATLASSELVQQFVQDMGIESEGNTIILLLDDPFLFVYYDITSPPACYLYSKNRLKYKSCDGDKNKFKVIMKHLGENDSSFI